MFAAEQEGQPTEHRHLAQPLLSPEKAANPIGEILVVGHRNRKVHGALASA